MNRGKQALELGLVDKLGSLEDAIEMAAEAADMDSYEVAYFPKEKPYFEMVLDKMNASVRTMIFGIESDPVIQKVEELKQLRGIQARLPGNLQVR